MKKSSFSKLIFFISILSIYLPFSLFAQGVGINPSGNPPDQSAILDASATNKGMLIPRLTTNQRDAIVSPAEGLIIFNTTTKCFEYFVYGVWQTGGMCATCPTPATPTATTHTSTKTQIVWNWSTVSGATGYKWNTTNSYATATDNVTNTTYTQTGLGCSTTYTLYVWAYNVCGNNSVATTLTQTTASCCDVASVTFTYRGNSVTYGTVAHAGKCWLDRNLGASQVANAYNDANAYGDLFQFGRKDDGHQSRTSSTQSGPTTNPTPGSNFIVLGSDNWYVGSSPAPDALWQGVSGFNNPCPTDWRLPTTPEFETERLSWTAGNNYSGAFASPLKFTAGGVRDPGAGALVNVGSAGYYWTSTISGPYAQGLYFTSSDGQVYPSFWRANAMSVRCVKN